MLPVLVVLLVCIAITVLCLRGILGAARFREFRLWILVGAVLPALAILFSAVLDACATAG